MSLLVIDVGTTGTRAAVMRPDGTLADVVYRRTPPTSPAPGLVEFDAAALAQTVVELAGEALARHGGAVEAVGISTQRASTVVWDAATGAPVGPAIGWQDLRTVIACITARAEHGLALAPNQSATKLAWLLDTHDPERHRDLRFGTVDSWLAWVLTGGAVHVTDRTNACVTGLLRPDGSDWSDHALEALRIDRRVLPALVDTAGPIAPAVALPGAPLLTALVGDQQASLIGQGAVRPGVAKITFGTGGMLDMCVGPDAPTSAARSAAGSFPIVAWSIGATTMWGAEAIMLAAGSNIEWLRDDLGLIADAAESHPVAASCDHTDGVVFVPALLGLGTPYWDYGARGALFGLTRGSGRPQIVRAVLEGIAHRGADLVEAAVADTGQDIATVRIDGGMSANPTFVRALADATGRPVEVAPMSDATTLGAGYLAGVGTGHWSGVDDLAELWQPRLRVEPSGSPDRDRWREAVRRTRGWIPDLSALDF